MYLNVHTAVQFMYKLEKGCMFVYVYESIYCFLYYVCSVYIHVMMQWTIPLLDKLLNLENQLAQLERAF